MHKKTFTLNFACVLMPVNADGLRLYCEHKSLVYLEFTIKFCFLQSEQTDISKNCLWEVNNWRQIGNGTMSNSLNLSPNYI